MFISMSVWAAESDVVTSNSVGATVSFSSSSFYKWEWDSSNQRLRSTNYYVPNSTSETSITITNSTFCEFSFDYTVSSESGCDYLIVTIDGTTVVNRSGYSSSKSINYLASGTHKIVLKYTKDSSDNDGDDRAYVSNFCFEKTKVGTIFYSNGIKYQIKDKSSVTVIANSYKGEISVPLSVEYDDGVYNIGAIETGALANCTSVALPIEYDFGKNSTLKKLYIEEGVTKFRGFSSCTALEDVSLPGTLTSIENTFTNCTSLKTVAFRYGTTKLGGLSRAGSNDNTFKNCKLDSIFVDREFYDVFSDFYSSPFSWNGTKHTLRAIRIGDNLTTVQANMFYNCNELRRIVLGNNLITIEDNAFGDCENIEGDLILPSTLRTIGRKAFSWGWVNAGEGKLMFNDGLTTIGDYAFDHCVKLNVSSIPSTLGSIGAYALSSAKFETLVIPSSITSIGTYAFGKITGKLIIEDGFSTLFLSMNAFNNYSSQYKSLYVGRNIVHNESSSCSPFDYDYSHNLQDVEIGDKVTSIPQKFLYRCSNLTSIIIGSNVSSIGKDAFDGAGLNSITIKAVNAPTITAPSYSSGIFSGIPIYVPSGSKASYQAANYWKNNIIIDSSDELIAVNLTMPGTLEGRLRIHKVEPAKVSKLKITGEMNDDDWACIKKTNMPNMYYLDLSGVTNTSIPEKQFQSHTYLFNVILPNEITSIGDYAFEGSKLSGDFTMPSSLEQIGNYAFKGTKIGDVSLSSNVTIGDYAFNNSNLRSITLNKCTNIGQYAFSSCRKLSGSYQLNSQLTTIPDYAFLNCISLEGIELPTTLKTIGNGTFKNCSKLNSLEFHNAITSFGTSTSSFEGCSGVTTIKTHWTKPISVLAATFSNVNKEKCTLYVPKGSTDWYLLSTGWKDFVNVIEYDDTEKDIAELNLIDGDPFASGYINRIGSLTYTRNFPNTAWQALYVPFTMQYSDWCEEFDVAEINNFHEYDDNGDGVTDRTELEVKMMVDGSSTEANMPYLIRAKSEGEKTLSLANAMLYASEENTVDCASLKTRYVFTGIYHGMSAEELNGCYAMSAGMLQPVAYGASLNAMRWYLKAETRNGKPLSARQIKVRVVNNVADEIAEITDSNNADKAYYNIAGQRVAKGTRGTLLISNGKKFINR